jgi:hypothetical protein
MPAEAIEIPVDVAPAFVGKNGRVSWTRMLVDHPDVIHINAKQLL